MEMVGKLAVSVGLFSEVVECRVGVDLDYFAQCREVGSQLRELEVGRGRGFGGWYFGGSRVEGDELVCEYSPIVRVWGDK